MLSSEFSMIVFAAVICIVSWVYYGKETILNQSLKQVHIVKVKNVASEVKSQEPLHYYYSRVSSMFLEKKKCLDCVKHEKQVEPDQDCQCRK